MPPETNVAEIPVVQTPAITTPVAPEPDLLSKVSQFKPPVQDKIENPPDQPEFATITDPAAKKAAAEAVERMRRGMQSDYTKKLEETKSLVEQSKSWTPQRIQQELLSNPEFVQAAQMVAANQPVNQSDRPLTQEEYSVLTDSEKERLSVVPELQNKVRQMEIDTQHQLLRNNIAQKDTTLISKYADYDPKAVDEASIRLSKSNFADLREDIYKALNYEKHVRNAYEMGKLEKSNLNQQKIDVIAPNGTMATNNDGVPTKMKGESDQALFVRIAQFRLAQHRKK